MRFKKKVHLPYLCLAVMYAYFCTCLKIIKGQYITKTTN